MEQFDYDESEDRLNINMDDQFDDDDDDDDDLDIDIEIETNAQEQFKKSTPKLLGKHSLKHDSIFKGKRSNHSDLDDYQSEYIIPDAGGSLDIKEESLDFEESRSNIDYYREVRLKQEIRNIIKNHTDINLKANRRKPSRSDFNANFGLLIKDLSQYGYTKSEIFVEFSGYFTDNIYNMFTLLDSEYCNIIISELTEKYGKSDIKKINFL